MAAVISGAFGVLWTKLSARWDRLQEDHDKLSELREKDAKDCQQLREEFAEYKGRDTGVRELAKELVELINKR